MLLAPHMFKDQSEPGWRCGHHDVPRLHFLVQSIHFYYPIQQEEQNSALIGLSDPVQFVTLANCFKTDFKILLYK